MGATSSMISGTQSVVHQEGDAEGKFGDIRRFVGSADGLVSTFDPKITTLYENFEEAVRKGADNPFLGVRAGDGYQWTTYKEAHKIVAEASAGLTHLGLAATHKVGIYSHNVPEWTLTAQACNRMNLTSVALYDTLGPDAVRYIINQAEIGLVVTNSKHTAPLLEAAGDCESLKIMVQLGETTDEDKKTAEAAGVQLLSWDELLALGREHPCEPTPPTADDIIFICYTSGTTGDPKGVMLSHGNIVADMAGAFTAGLALGEGEVHVSYLPLAHVFERLVQEAIITYAGGIGFYGGDILKLMEDIAILRPTIFASVPRLFNRLYDKVTAAVEAKGGIGAALFNQALAAKKAGLADGYLTHGLWDRLVFGKVRARLGGRVKYMVTGSAPLSPAVMEFLRVCFSCPVLEGYGATETSAAATLTSQNDFNLGHVGPPMSCNEIRLESIPDMSYLVTDEPYPRGEVCVRGANVCKGYYKMPEKTAETIDSEGWYHTGDVGLWLPNGTLKIIDRKKNLFKLAQGEYVAPEKIENIYSREPRVAQVFIYGNSLKASIVGIIVPDFETLSAWARENGKADIADDKEALCQDADVKKSIMDGCKAVGKDSGLHGFEQIRGIILFAQPLEEIDCLTPTFKLKRNVAKEYFQDQIDEVYKDLQ